MNKYQNKYTYLYGGHFPKTLKGSKNVNMLFAYYLLERYIDESIGGSIYTWSDGNKEREKFLISEFFKNPIFNTSINNFNPRFFLENVFLPDLTENHYKKLTQVFYLGLRELKREGLISSIAWKQKRFNDDEKYNYQSFKLSDKFKYDGWLPVSSNDFVKIPNYVFTNSFKKEQNTDTEITVSIKAFCIACFILKTKRNFPYIKLPYKTLGKIIGCFNNSNNGLIKYCKLIENNKILFRYTTRQWGNPTKMTPQVFSLLKDEEAAREAAFEYRGDSDKGKSKTFNEDEYAAETWE